MGPSFLVIPMPESEPPDTGCGPHEGYQFSSHYQPGFNNHALFFAPPTGTLRTRCGGLAFDETQIGAVELRYQVIPSLANYEMWARRQRGALPPLSFDDVLMYLGSIAPDSQYHQFAAPAQSAFDLTAFSNRHAITVGELGTDPSSPFTVNSDALAQLWRAQATPGSFTVGFLTVSQPLLNWANQHPGRATDSTEIYRKVNGGVWAYHQRVAGTVTSFVDGPLPAGTYSYFIRHVTALATTVSDNPPIARPASAATAAKSVATGAPPPTGLSCEGNFDPTMDCRWYNAVADAPVEVLRGGVPRDTEPGGAVGAGHLWTDAVTSGQTYSYQVRHLVSGAPGRLSSPPHSAVANPVPPENLVCAGTDVTTITCVWADREPDTVAVERKQSPFGSWTPVGNVLAGVMTFVDEGLPRNKEQCYRVRHRRGSAYTAYSNQACATPGDGGPLRPQP
jgi:hypothetical protein